MKFIQGVKDQVARFVRDEEAASAIEYAVVAGLLVVGLLAAFPGFIATIGTSLSTIVGLIPTSAAS